MEVYWAEWVILRKQSNKSKCCLRGSFAGWESLQVAEALSHTEQAKEHKYWPKNNIEA